MTAAAPEEVLAVTNRSFCPGSANLIGLCIVRILPSLSEEKTKDALTLSKEDNF